MQFLTERHHYCGVSPIGNFPPVGCGQCNSVLPPRLLVFLALAAFVLSVAWSFHYIFYLLFNGHGSDHIQSLFLSAISFIICNTITKKITAQLIYQDSRQCEWLMLISSLTFLYWSFVILWTLILGVDVPRYASLLTTTLFLGGIQLIGIGVLSEYL